MKRSRSAIRFANTVILGVWLGISVPAVHSQESEPYIKSYQGPYRGRVIDAGTRQPIAGAAVVAIWASMKDVGGYYMLVFHEAREVLTDSNGEFILNAEEIEVNAPPQTYRPTFIIFSPGYGSYPDFHVSPAVLPGIFEGSGATVELPLLSKDQDRLRVILSFPPLIPGEKIPNLLRLVNIERANLKLGPP